jgi:hypothetical protein
VSLWYMLFDRYHPSIKYKCPIQKKPQKHPHILEAAALVFQSSLLS